MDSFAAKVREELAGRFAPDMAGMCAELAGMFSAALDQSDGKAALRGLSNASAEKAGTLLTRVFHVQSDEVTVIPSGTGSGNAERVDLVLNDPQKTADLLDMMGLLDEDGLFHRIPCEFFEKQTDEQAFLRGIFLAGGTISDPRKAYHVEIVDDDADYLEEIAQLMMHYDVQMHMTQRRRGSRSMSVLYLKDGEQLVDFLNVVQAYTALMDLENIRIEKEMRNQINRSVNCEAANLGKVVQASLKQTEDIRYLVETLGWEGLPSSLAQMGRIRLEHPDESLAELGTYFTPPVGRSGVNHRLRRLSELAEETRKKRSAGTENKD